MIQSDAARDTELGDEVDLPFIAWDNSLTLASATITSSRPVLTDGALENAISGTTYDYWLPDVAGAQVSYNVQFTTARRFTFAAIVGHNLGTLGGTVRVRRSTDGGATWSDAGAGEITPTNDEPIGFRMIDNASNNAADWQFYFAGLTAGDPLYVAGLFFGKEKIFPVGVYSGFAPPIYPTEVQLQSNVSNGGNLLGSSVIAQGTSLSAKFPFLSPSFVRTDLATFIPSFNQGNPFWFAWRPDTFTSDLRYCWRDGAAAVPVNEGGLDYMSLPLSMRAYEA